MCCPRRRPFRRANPRVISFSIVDFHRWVLPLPAADWGDDGHLAPLAQRGVLRGVLLVHREHARLQHRLQHQHQNQALPLALIMTTQGILNIAL